MVHHSKNKSQVQIRLELLGFYLIYISIRLLPLKQGYHLAQWLFRILYRLDSRHRRRTIQHILHAGIVKKREEAEQMARDSYEQFSRLLIEILKSDQFYEPERITVSGNHAGCRFFTDYASQPAPQMILISAHYGNWEIAGNAIAEKSGRPLTSMMRGFDNPRIGKLILRNRVGSGHTSVDKCQGIRPLLRAIARQENLALLIDQHAGAGEGVTCSFFGHPAKVHKTPALLYLKTGIPIVPEVTRRLPGNKFQFEIVCGAPICYTPTGDKQHDVQEITQQCISALEALIRQDPVQWLWTPRHWLDINRGGVERLPLNNRKKHSNSLFAKAGLFL